MAISISLSPKQEAQVIERVQSGEYATVSDVVRCALKLLEHQERKEHKRLHLLREQLYLGFEQIEYGDTQVYDKSEVERLKAECRTAAYTVEEPRKVGNTRKQ